VVLIPYSGNEGGEQQEGKQRVSNKGSWSNNGGRTKVLEQRTKGTILTIEKGKVWLLVLAFVGGRLFVAPLSYALEPEQKVIVLLCVCAESTGGR
jgi:hypothetical protein